MPKSSGAAALMDLSTGLSNAAPSYAQQGFPYDGINAGGFRWSQRTVFGPVIRKTRRGHLKIRMPWDKTTTAFNCPARSDPLSDGKCDETHLEESQPNPQWLSLVNNDEV